MDVCTCCCLWISASWVYSSQGLCIHGGRRMTSICPDCGKDSLMFGNIGAMFGIPPYCANIHCPSQELGEDNA